jgi:hypothetical protein
VKLLMHLLYPLTKHKTYFSKLKCRLSKKAVGVDEVADACIAYCNHITSTRHISANLILIHLKRREGREL